FDIHNMTVAAARTDGDITRLRCTMHRYTFGPGVIGPVFGITPPSPIWHVLAVFPYLPGCVTDALAFVHAPRVRIRIREWLNICPWIACGVGYIDTARTATAPKTGVFGSLLAA